MKRNERSAFTLIELIIVIFLLALTAYFGYELVLKPKSSRFVLTPETLRLFLREHTRNGEEGVLVCTNACRTCYFSASPSSPFEKIDVPVRLGELEVYTLQGIPPKTSKVSYEKFSDEPICLRIHMHENGSVTPLVLKNKKGTYRIPAYFGSVTRTASLDEATAEHQRVYKALLHGEVF
jgi:prepilin-type N-terminal cleavage/methylation domain-containing protein